MTQRVALLNGNNINQDFDLSKIFEAFSESGVVKGLEVQAGNVTPGFAFVEVQREGKKFCILFENTENFSIDTSGNKKIFIEISENNILNGTINSEDGTGIGIIKSADYFPSKNFLALAEITNGQIRDTRVFVRIRDSVAGIENITSNLVRKSIKINPGEDLNNIKTPGFYYNGANVESDQILNHPKRQFSSKLQHMYDSAFGMIVYEASGVIQELTLFNATHKFIRRFYDNNWTPWYVMWIRPNWTMNEKSHFLAIGDDDTGIAQESDGVLGIYANNLKVAEIQQAGIYSNRPQANSGNSLVRKDYVDKRSDNNITVFDVNLTLPYEQGEIRIRHNHGKIPREIRLSGEKFNTTYINGKTLIYQVGIKRDMRYARDKYIFDFYSESYNQSHLLIDNVTSTEIIFRGNARSFPSNINIGIMMIGEQY